MKLKKVYFHNCYYEKIGNNEPVKLEDLPFDIPDNWAWVRINNYVQKVTDFVASGSFASLRENVKYYKEENYALMVKTQDFQNNFSKDLTFTDKHGYNFLENSNLDGGELVLANVGSIGKVFIVPKLNRPMTLAPNSIMVRFFYEAHLQWFLKLFQSSFGLELLLSISSATAIKKFNKTDFKTLLIPLPPLEEQQRIVDKINSFEPLLERYDKVEKELSKLEKEFPEKLKKSILQYAIEGKLVKQNPNDEPASALLERIKQDKERLIKEGKIKKEKNDNLIIQADYKNYYENIPENWRLCTIKDICSYGNTIFYFSPVIGDWLLELEDIESGSSIILNRKSIVSNTNMNSKVYFDKNMILYSKLRPYLDKVLIAPERGVATSEIVPFYSYINSKFLIYFLRSPYFLNRVKNLMYGVKMPRLGTNDMLSTIFFLPPLEEQSKIVNKITEIFKAID